LEKSVRIRRKNNFKLEQNRNNRNSPKYKMREKSKMARIPHI